MDFGVAKLTSGGAATGATAVGRLLGSVHYASPELAKGSGDIDHRTDIWSLGVIIYHALTGHLPFTGANDGDVIVNICASPHVPPSQLVRDLPPDVDHFMDRALAKDPGDRFQLARELSQAFKRLVGHLSTTSGPTVEAPLGLPRPGPVAVAPSALSGQPQAMNAALAAAIEPAAHSEDASGIVHTGARGTPASGIVPAELTDSLSAPSGVIPPSLLDSLASQSQNVPPELVEEPLSAGQTHGAATPLGAEANELPVDLRPRRGRGAVIAAALVVVAVAGGVLLWSGGSDPSETTPSEGERTAEPAPSVEPPATTESAAGMPASTAEPTAAAEPPEPSPAPDDSASAAAADAPSAKPKAAPNRSAGSSKSKGTSKGDSSKPATPAPAADDPSWMNSRF
jgi:serine/threonine-protein kinase